MVQGGYRQAWVAILEGAYQAACSHYCAFELAWVWISP